MFKCNVIIYLYNGMSAIHPVKFKDNSELHNVIVPKLIALYDGVKEYDITDLEVIKK